MLRYMYCCPSCGAKFDPRTVSSLHAHSFSCPSCGAPLHVAANHPEAIFVASVILSVALTFYLGFRGLVVTILGFGLIWVLLSFIVGLVWPPKVELRPPTDLSLFPNGPRK